MDPEKLKAIKQALRDEAYGLDMGGKSQKDTKRPDLMDPDPWRNLPASRWKGALRETPAVKERDNASGDSAFADESKALADLWPKKQQAFWDDVPLPSVNAQALDLPWKTIVRQVPVQGKDEHGALAMTESWGRGPGATSDTFFDFLLAMAGTSLVERFSPDVPEIVVSWEEWSKDALFCLHQFRTRHRDLMHPNDPHLVVSDYLRSSLLRNVEPWRAQAYHRIMQFARLDGPVAYCSTPRTVHVPEPMYVGVDEPLSLPLPYAFQEAEVMVELSIGSRTNSWRRKEYAVWGSMVPVVPMTRLRVEVPKTETTDVVIFTGQTVTITLPAGLKDDLVKHLSVGYRPRSNDI